MKTLIIASLLISSAAFADVKPEVTTTTITGAEATKIANLAISGGDQAGTYAAGTFKVSCVEKAGETDFTCSVVLMNRGPASKKTK